MTNLCTFIRLMFEIYGAYGIQIKRNYLIYKNCLLRNNDIALKRLCLLSKPYQNVSKHCHLTITEVMPFNPFKFTNIVKSHGKHHGFSAKILNQHVRE